jgi:RNA polymerase sigma-70 factor (ECF subfamily)
VPLPKDNLSDESLIEHYKTTGDKQAVGELFKRYSLMCFAVCNKYYHDTEKANDAAMAVFEKLFTDLQNHTIKNFKSWLHTVCRNYCLMQLRKPEILVPLNTVAEESDDGFMQLDNFLHQDNKEEKLQELEKALLWLNDKQRQCIDLFYLKKKSYKEISDETGYTTSDVRSQIQNGKRNLKITLKQKGITFCAAILLWIQHTA